MRRFLTRVATVAVAAATLAAPALPAGAAAAATTGLSFRPLHYNINGYNWGGYAATGSGFTSVSATWTEANATCNSTNDLYAPWVGIDGYGSSTVEQTGVATDCSSGRPVHQAWYEMYPANPVYLSVSSYPVSAGDHITASVTYAGGSSYTLKLDNSTRGWTYSTTKSLSVQPGQRRGHHRVADRGLPELRHPQLHLGHHQRRLPRLLRPGRARPVQRRLRGPDQRARLQRHQLQ